MIYALRTLFILSTLTLAACMYDPVIHQGKSISDSDLNKLHLQMTQDEVSTLLGTPFIQDNATTNQWRYIASQSQHHKQTIHETVLSFKDRKLVKIEKKVRHQEL